ncbi:Porin-like protein NicP [compost metagenome]
MHDDGRAADDYGRAGLAAKMRVSDTEMMLGELMPDIPLLRYDDGRLLPQTFQGAMLVSRELPGLSLQAGQYNAVSLRNSSDMQDLSAWAAPTVKSDGFNYAGAEYRFNEQQTQIGAWYSQLEDIYQQSYLNLLHKQKFGDWTLGANLGYFIDKDDGSALIGNVQSHTAYGLFSANLGGHTLYLGLQKVSGDTGWMSVYGSSGRTLGNDMFNGNFSNADERSWQARYDYNFAAVGLPGLTGMARYLRGSHIDLPQLGGTDLTESSKDVELAYVIQSGPAKGLALRLRHALYRNEQSAASTFRSDNETRINVDYTIQLW